MRVTALRRVERARGGLALAVGGEPVDRVGRHDDEPAGAERARPPRRRSASTATRPRRRGRGRRGRGVTRDVGVARARSRSAADARRACPSCDLEHERAARPRGPRGASRTSASVCLAAEERDVAAPSRAPRGASDASSSGSTYGGLETTRSQAVPGGPRTGRARRAPRRGRSARRSRGRARAPRPRRRCPVTRAPGCSSAIASAIAPDPVPTSSTRGASSAVEQREAALDDRLGLRARDERAAVDARA